MSNPTPRKRRTTHPATPDPGEAPHRLSVITGEEYEAAVRRVGAILGPAVRRIIAKRIGGEAPANE